MTNKSSLLTKRMFGSRLLKIAGFVAVIIGLAGISGCSKEKNEQVDYNDYITAGEEYVVLQNLAHENLKWIYRAMQHPEMDDGIDTMRKVIVKRDSMGGDSVMYTLDYRKSWFDYDGLHKDSIIRIMAKGDMKQPGDKATAVLDGFQMEDRRFEGRIDYQKMKDTTGGLAVIRIRTQDVQYRDTTGRSHSIELSQQAHVKKYLGTPGNMVLSFTVTGQAEGVASNQKAYNAIIPDTSLLLDSLTCTRIQSGHVVLQVDGGEAGHTYIDFLAPTDTCNRKYSIHLDNEKYDLLKSQ